MKLELKHLAPYLPYELKAIIRLREDSSLPIDDECVVNVSCFEAAYLGSEYDEFKPILRPLSDLNKEIDFNGDLFTPNHHPSFKLFISNDMDWFIDNCPYFVDYLQVQKLLEWHFDVFGLIPAGLAIDTNTLKNL